MALDIVLTWKYSSIRYKIEQMIDSFSNKIIFTKAIYLSDDHVVFCYFEEKVKMVLLFLLFEFKRSKILLIIVNLSLRFFISDTD